MRGYLDRVLGMALSLKNSSFELKPLLVALGETKIVEVIKPIEKQQYVLTLDYTLKVCMQVYPCYCVCLHVLYTCNSDTILMFTVVMYVIPTLLPIHYGNTR